MTQDHYHIANHPAPLTSGLVDLLGQVETATIGHIEHWGFLANDIRPVFPARAIGRAVTVAAPGRDGKVIYMAIDRLEPGDILVIARVDADGLACVGGGVTAAAKAKGAAAIILDGPCTDPDEIIENGLPVWCRGVSARTTSRHISIGGAINEPVACGGAAVLPGYCVLADTSGIFLADPDRMRRVAHQALTRQRRSITLRPHLEAGKSIFDFDAENGK